MSSRYASQQPPAADALHGMHHAPDLAVVTWTARPSTELRASSLQLQLEPHALELRMRRAREMEKKQEELKTTFP